MLDSFYHMTLKLLKKLIFDVKMQDFVIINPKLKWKYYVMLQNL